MRRMKSLMASVLVTIVCASCAQDPNAPQSSGKTLAGAADTSKAPANKQQGAQVRLPDAPIERAATPAGAQGAAVAAAPKAADTSDMPIAPKDAQWTIYCATIEDANHVETSRMIKKKLVQDTALREWYIVHETSRSRIYYGFYRSIADKADAAESGRAQADRKKIDAWKDGNGERPFSTCQFVQLSAPDPDSPPEWNLTGIPRDKMWTVMVAAYKDHPDRKKAAVDSVREARAQGIEAYYFHGDTVSNVFIGSWPEEAMAEERIDTDPGRKGNSQDDLLVLPPGFKDPGKVSGPKGEKVRAVSQNFVPVDEKLKQTLAKYPEMGVNGERLVYKVKGNTRVQRSQVIRIPHPADLNLTEEPAQEAANTALVNPTEGAAQRRARYDAVRQSAGQSDGGRLRSINDK